MPAKKAASKPVKTAKEGKFVVEFEEKIAIVTVSAILVVMLLYSAFASSIISSTYYASAGAVAPPGLTGSGGPVKGGVAPFPPPSTGSGDCAYLTLYCISGDPTMANMIVYCFNGDVAQQLAAMSDEEIGNIFEGCEIAKGPSGDPTPPVPVDCSLCTAENKLGCCYDIYDDGTTRFRGMTTQADCRSVAATWDPECKEGIGNPEAAGCCICMGVAECEGATVPNYYRRNGQASEQACLDSCSSGGFTFVGFDTSDPDCAKSDELYGKCGDCVKDVMLGEECDPPGSACDFGVPCNSICRCAEEPSDWCKKNTGCGTVTTPGGEIKEAICKWDVQSCSIIQDTCAACPDSTPHCQGIPIDPEGNYVDVKCV